MIKSDEKKDDISKDVENKDSTKDTKTPSKPLLPKSAILKLLAELVKSYAGVSQLVTEYSHNAKLSSVSEVSGNFSFRNLSKGVFERRRSTGSGLFYIPKQWFCPNFQLNRLYKYKETKQYKLYSVKAYYGSI